MPISVQSTSRSIQPQRPSSPNHAIPTHQCHQSQFDSLSSEQELSQYSKEDVPKDSTNYGDDDIARQTLKLLVTRKNVIKRSKLN